MRVLFDKASSYILWLSALSAGNPLYQPLAASEAQFFALVRTLKLGPLM